MQPFRDHSGIVAPMLIDNIDTDAIIPSREMKQVSKTGLADGLFAGWRYLNPATRQQNPEFVLNRPEYAQASIILSGKNFGCGSSREHAVWALAEYGIRSILAESFGAIFYKNCIRNGVLPVQLGKGDVENLAAVVASGPPTKRLTIQLEAQTLHCADEFQCSFEIRAADKEMLLHGLDPIDITKRFNDQVTRFEQQQAISQPWIRL